MKTAEEIAKKWYVSHYQTGGLNKEVLAAMEEYAEECMRHTLDVAFSTGKLHQVDKNLTNEQWKEMREYLITNKHKLHKK